MFINGIAAHRMGDATVHCGGNGKLVEGSPDVIIGGKQPEKQASEDEPLRYDVRKRIVFPDGSELANEAYDLIDGEGTVIRSGSTDSKGLVHERDLPLGNYFIKLKSGWLFEG